MQAITTTVSISRSRSFRFMALMLVGKLANPEPSIHGTWAP